MERIALGVIGCGGMGRRHLRAYRALRDAGSDRFEIVALCDVRREAAEEAAVLVEELLGSRPAVVTDYESLLASGTVEALDVVTEPSTHHLLVVPALEAGIHVTCEKPLGLTVRACRRILDAAASSSAVLSVAENYRRDGPNRLARAVIDSGMLGELHLMVQMSLGGGDGIIISPWRHLRDSGSIALDMGVHYSDIIRYYLGEFGTVFGSSFVAEPLRRYAAGAVRAPGIEEVEPGAIRATGDDSVVATYEMASGVLVQLSYVPSGPGRHWSQRSLHGRNGSMSVPPDRTGQPVVVELGAKLLSGAALRAELGGFELDGVTAALFGADGTEYDKPFSEIDAATIGIELDDFGRAVSEGAPAEVDGYGGLIAVAAIWAVAESRRRGESVAVQAVADGVVSGVQDEVDKVLGLC
ncbi:MAG TPA: Gfo/Idh/MocA family oxidoreductase [Acidimicrobiales bacterium]|nr:Gfo/Idh/MocA family oxidoreductase [Acidimicrobiales bacterium]